MPSVKLDRRGRPAQRAPRSSPAPRRSRPSAPGRAPSCSPRRGASRTSRSASVALRERPHHGRIVESATCCARPTTARSSVWRCPRSARSRPSRSTCSSTRRSSATSARRSWPRWRSPRRAHDASSPSATSSPTGRPRRSRGCTAPATTPGRRARRAGAVAGARDRAGARAGRRARRRPARRAHRRRAARPPSCAAATCGSARSACRGARRPRRPGLPARGRRPAHAAGRSSSSRTLVNVVLELLFVYGLELGLDGLGAGDGDRAARDGRGVRGVLLRAPAGPARARPRAARARCVRIARRAVRAHRRRCSAPSRSRARCSRGSARRRWPRTRSPSSCSSSSRSCSTRSRSPAQVLVGRALGAGDARGRPRRRAARDRLVGRPPAPVRRACCWRAGRRAAARCSPTTRAVHRARARDLADVRRSCSPRRPPSSRSTGSSSAPATRATWPARCCSPGSASTSRSRCWRSQLGWGITGVWAGLLALVGVRLLTLGARFAGGRWALTGAAACSGAGMVRRPPPAVIVLARSRPPRGRADRRPLLARRRPRRHLDAVPLEHHADAASSSAAGAVAPSSSVQLPRLQRVHARASKRRALLAPRRTRSQNLPRTSRRRRPAPEAVDLLVGPRHARQGEALGALHAHAPVPRPVEHGMPPRPGARAEALSPWWRPSSRGRGGEERTRRAVSPSTSR